MSEDFGLVRFCAAQRCGNMYMITVRPDVLGNFFLSVCSDIFNFHKIMKIEWGRVAGNKEELTDHDLIPFISCGRMSKNSLVAQVFIAIKGKFWWT